MNYKTTRSFQVWRASPVADRHGVVVGEIQGSARNVRWKSHRSKPDTFTFYPNAEGEKRGLRHIIDTGVKKILASLQN